jgi:hypothetical protein
MSITDWFITKLFCPACFRVKFGIGHWVSCK